MTGILFWKVSNPACSVAQRAAGLQLQALCLQMEMLLLLFPLFFSNISSSRTVTELPGPERQPSSSMDAHQKWHRPGWEWHWEPRGKSWAVRWHKRELGRQLEPENNTGLNAYNKNSQNAGNLSVIPKGLRQAFSILGRNQDEDKNKIRLVRWSVASESFSRNACHMVLWKLVSLARRMSQPSLLPTLALLPFTSLCGSMPR